MIYFYGVFVFLAGLTIGSFINVCIYRLPRHISIVRPRSRCPSCGAQIKAWHNIPLISFLLLRGRCAYCGARISWRYPIVELLTGLLFLLAYVDLWLDKANFIGFIIGLYLSSVFLIIFFIDLEHRIIPDSLTISGMIIGFGTSFLPGSALPWYLSLIGLLAGGLIFLAVAEIGDRIFKKESLGGGDIKLAAMLGAFLGWKGILLVLAIGSFLGAVIGGVSLAMAEDKQSARTIPFGPFLVVAALIVFYRGSELIRLYLRLISR